MPKKIRVTETRVIEYIPQIGEDYNVYDEANITTIEEALELDKQEYKDDRFELLELGDPKVSVKWEIVDEAPS